MGDILTTQKLDLGKLDFNQEDIKIDEFLNAIIKEFKPIADAKKIQLNLDFVGNTHMSSDKDRLNQVFSNLIKNAIDFVSKNSGKITIGAKDNSDHIEFFVQDNGSGISISNQNEVFKKFYQIDTSTSRKRSGSGLGLAICKGIVEASGGKIWVKSEENVQTTFFFKIPKKLIKLTVKNEKNKEI